MAPRTVVLSLEQQRAISSPGDLFIRAGAGSGKTEVLARRFVALVAGVIPGLPPLDPERIAAVTFSEKAAHDMRERIAAVLTDAIARAPDDETRLRLRRASRRLPLACITTLHAFCARLLRENALAAGLDPAFDILDEYQSTVFLQREAERVLLAAARADDAGVLYLAAARGLRGSIYREGALPIVLRLINELNRAGRDPLWMLDRTRNAAQQTLAARGEVNAIALQIAALIDQLLALSGLTGAAAAKVAELECRWPILKPALLGFDADSLYPALNPLRDLQSLFPTAQAAKSKAIVEQLRPLLHKNGAIGLTGALIEAWGAQRAAPPALDVAHLLTQVADAIAAAKRLHAAVTFDDLLLLTRGLLRSNPSVVKRYQELFGALLVDEFQDTDTIQDEIIAALCAPSSAARPSLFIVGDEKQSIYRFRGADVTVFDARRQSGLQVLPLSQNRRSTPAIVAFANAFGASMMRTDTPSPPPYWVQWTHEHHLLPTRTGAFNPPVEILRELTAPTSLAGRTVEALAIARRINAIVTEGVTVFDPALEAERSARFGDIAILLRAFTDVAIYERALRAAGVPFYTVKGRGLFGCQEVIDLVELLTTINDPRDSLALAAALRSPFFTLSDDALLEIALYLRARAESGVSAPSSLAELFAAPDPPDFAWLEHDRAEAAAAWRTLHELRADRDRSTIAALLDRIIELTGFEAVMLAADPSGQRAANIRRLLELARAFEAHQFFTFHDFVAYLRRLVEEEPREPQAQILGENENVVRLMTVHQAKGLEFPIVIVADLWRGMPRANATPLLSPAAGLVICATVGSGYDEVPHRALDELRNALADQEKAESARILYVALTRARDRLIMSAAGKPARGSKSGTWGHLLEQFITPLGATLESTDSSSPPQTLTCDGGVSLLLRQPDIAPSKVETAGPASVPLRERDRFAAIARTRIAFATPAAGCIVLSPTELEVIARCPREYQSRYLLSLPIDHGLAANPWTAIGAAKDMAASALQLGIAAHAILERLDFGASRISDHELERLLEEIAIQSDLDPAARTTLFRDLSRYLAEATFPPEIAIEREIPFFLKVGDAPTLFVRGRIDLLCIAPQRVTIRDYKYARPAADTSAYQIQMELYALAVADAYPDREVSAELIFLRETPRVVPIALPPLPSIRNRLHDLARQFVTARASGEWIKRPSAAPACRQLGCGYVARCWGIDLAAPTLQRKS